MWIEREEYNGDNDIRLVSTIYDNYFDTYIRRVIHEFLMAFKSQFAQLFTIINYECQRATQFE